ncbi:hypothetical protein K0U91_03950 [Chryseobacterium chendengshani]|uniref:hypothetical protein n=1 Tax=Chryseobacterium sp. LJ668 TaxID=2864040 RepID=UPI001C68F0A0|nr:hypothetical protein [Chryseobacterium sp. LJ668]MBW8524564.1 hypothetical protein [Chryseobacterium sp. LJ668]QYK17287.1 hypothetical protein K0U91_03950 [Chryseobacterium sp. LJ668]
MGLLFVIFFHFIAIFILSFIIGIVALLLIYFLDKGEKKKRKLFIGFSAPFIGFYSLYIFAFLGSVFVSEIKNVDMGVGDAWFVPLENKYELLFINLPETAFIAKHDNGEILVSDITDIEERNNIILGKKDSDSFFSFNTDTEELKEFDNKEALSKAYDKIKLENAYKFYSEKRDDISGSWFIMVGIISLLASIILLYVFKRIFLINFNLKKSN